MKIPKTFTTIKQPKDSGICIACVAAMATNTTLALAQQLMKGTRRGGHLYYKERELMVYLGRHGISYGIFARVLENPIDEHMLFEFKWNPMGNPCVMHVKSDHWVGGFHVVLWDGKHVRDPNPDRPNTTKMSDYVVCELVPLIYHCDSFQTIPQHKIEQC